MEMGITWQSRKIPVREETEGKVLGPRSWVWSVESSFFKGGELSILTWIMWEFWGTDAGEWVGVEVGDCGSLFQGASFFLSEPGSWVST